MIYTTSITLYSKEPQFDDMALLGVPVGRVDVRLMGVYERIAVFVTDWQEFLFCKIKEKLGIQIKEQEDVKDVLNILRFQKMTFPEWFHGWMKAELLEDGFDYDLKFADKEK